jgi:hypothetical protein
VRFDSDSPLLFGLRIHGQYVFVDAERHLVIARVSSQAMPLDAAGIALTTGRIGGTARSISLSADRLAWTAARTSCLPLGRVSGAAYPLRQTVASHGCLCRGSPGGR